METIALILSIFLLLMLNEGSVEILVDGKIPNVATKNIYKHFARRPLLDGMKGFLVVLIVLFHLDFKLFSFGYIGIDAGFVLSGYITTSVIIREIFQTQKLNLLHFYAKRFRILVPASLIVVLTSCVIYKNLVIDVLVETHRNSFIAGTLFTENIYLTTISASFVSYSTKSTPLMNYWALGVCEQFFLVFPISLMYCVDSLSLDAKKLCFALGSLIVVLVGFQFYSVSSMDPSQVFFSTYFRSYQLLAGCLLAVVLFRLETPLGTLQLFNDGPQNDQSVRLFGVLFSLLGFVGLVVLVSPIVTFSSYIHGVVAVLCAGALIFGLECCREDTILNRILTSHVVQFLGIHSYEIYLWHYPVIVMTKLLQIRTHENGDFISEVEIIVVVIILAYITKYSLAPLQQAKWEDIQWLCAIALAIVCVVVAIMMMSNVSTLEEKNVPNESGVRLDPTDVGQHVVENVAEQIQQEAATFSAPPPPPPRPQSPHSQGAKPAIEIPSPPSQEELEISAKTKHLLIGDSVTSDWMQVYVPLQLLHGINDLQPHKLNLCPWIPGKFLPFDRNPDFSPIRANGDKEYQNCKGLDAMLLTFLEGNGRRVAILEGFQALECSIAADDGSQLFPGDDRWDALIEKKIRDVVVPAFSKNPELHLIALEPHYVRSEDIVECFTQFRGYSNCAGAAPEKYPFSDNLIAIYTKFATEFPKQFHSINFNKLICPNDLCLTADDHQIPVFDSHTHLTQEFLAAHYLEVDALLRPYL